MRSLLINSEEEAPFEETLPSFEDKLRHLEMLRMHAATQIDQMDLGQGKAEFKSILELPPPPTFGAGGLSMAIVNERKRAFAPPAKLEEVKRPLDVFTEKPIVQSAKPAKTLKRPPSKAAPVKDFIKENAMNISRKPSRQSTLKKAPALRPVEEVPPLVIRSGDYLKQELAKLQLDVVQRYNSQSSDVPKAHLLKNSNLLQSVFSQFTDLIAIKWEEAADALLDEILADEVFRLNSLDQTESKADLYTLEGCDFAQLLGFIDEVKGDEARLLNKYCRGSAVADMEAL